MATFDARVVGRIRKLLEAIDSEAVGLENEQIAMTQQLELLVASGASIYGEVTRPGRSFYTGTTTAVAAVVAIPTTAHMFALYNSAPDGGKSMVVDWMALSSVASTASSSQVTMIANLGQQREAIPVNAAQTIKKANGYGQSGIDTVASTVTSSIALPAVTGVAANWFPAGPPATKIGSGATPGYGAWWSVDGRFIVPPGRYFAMHAIAPVVGETFQAYIGWHEKQLTLG